MIKNISFISAHFYDFDWTELLVRNIKRYTDETLIKEIILINQDRTQDSCDRLQALGPKVRVVEYPRSELHFKLQGHDHAAALNQAIREVRGEYVGIFDSDAHPMKADWIGKCEQIFEYYDAILALVPGKVLDTHPCFMFIRNEKPYLNILFDEGLESRRLDVGRMVGKQLINQGKRVYFTSHQDSFLGRWGRIYLNAIYHHQGGSFSGSEDARVRSRLKWQSLHFKRLVVRKRIYNFTVFDLIRYIFSRLIHSIIRKPKKIKF